MPFYELVFITRQDLSQTQTETLAASFKNVLEKEGGKVVSDEYWGVRQLAYRIKKNRKGHYHLFNIDASPAAVAELDRVMKLNEDLLRFQVVRVDALQEGPSVQLRYRSDREESDEGDGRKESYRSKEGRESRSPQDGYRKSSRLSEEESPDEGALLEGA